MTKKKRALRKRIMAQKKLIASADPTGEMISNQIEEEEVELPDLADDYDCEEPADFFDDDDELTDTGEAEESPDTDEAEDSDCDLDSLEIPDDYDSQELFPIPKLPESLSGKELEEALEQRERIGYLKGRAEAVHAYWVDPENPSTQAIEMLEKIGIELSDPAFSPFAGRKSVWDQF